MAARTFGQVYCSIWDDPEFIALGAGAQRTYLMLTTSDDIGACGIVPLRLRRWARTCSEKQLTDWLAELVAARFVSIDEDTEELFVRTFAKWDRGYLHTIRRKAVISTARAIKSPELRSTSVDELGKLGVDVATPEPPDRHTSATPEAVESRGVPVTLGDHQLEPETGILEREPIGTGAEPSPFCRAHPTGTDKPCRDCATAREYLRLWIKTADELATRTKAARVEATANCSDCDENGFVLDALTSLPTAECKHVHSSRFVPVVVGSHEPQNQAAVTA